MPLVDLPVTVHMNNNEESNEEEEEAQTTAPTIDSNHCRNSITTTQPNHSENDLHSTHNCQNEYEKHLKAKLRFFFMSPCWKWRLKRQFPWKACFQLIKIIVVTTQLILFGIEREMHVIYISESNITFHHLFLKEWSSTFETLPYPQTVGDYAVYTDDELINEMNYAINRYNNMTEISLGLFDFHTHNDLDASNPQRTVKICLNRFDTCTMFPSNHT
ncbi:unnamed protein product, partial [Didymodactylos carnosus]